MTYGIPISMLPVTDSGKIKNDQHKKWLARRVAKDDYVKELLATCTHGQIPPSFEGIDFPGPNDVLLGRGKPFREHTGNVRLRNIVEEYQEEYDNIEIHGHKAKVAEFVITIVEDAAPLGRFLKLHPVHGWWVVASRDESIEKVQQAFRTARSVSANVKSKAGRATSVKATALRKNENTKRVKVVSTVDQENGFLHHPTGNELFSGYVNEDDDKDRCCVGCFSDDRARVTM